MYEFTCSVFPSPHFTHTITHPEGMVILRANKREYQNCVDIKCDNIDESFVCKCKKHFSRSGTVCHVNAQVRMI